jgi:trk system potassium uptake protein TrkH
MRRKKIDVDLKPTQILVLGFLLLIAIGTLLLNLPIASRSGECVGFIDALFTSTSAVCVTGLVVVDTFEHWTLFGQVVILLLIQVGGLGFMTITTTLFILLGRKIRLKERLIIQEALNQYTISGMVRLSKNILLGTFLIEGVGAVILAIRFIPEYGSRGVFMGIFHSVSAFCNAGFDILNSNGASLSPYVGDLTVNIVIMLLIILGGLGFTVWLDILRVVQDKTDKAKGVKAHFRKLSLHTKLVLVITGSLIVFGFVFFLLTEGNNLETLGRLSLGDKLLASLFQSVTTRTAGFNTIPLQNMGYAAQFMTIILMFIGGSPAGTAGGVKTVTFGVIFLAVISFVRNKEDVEIFERRIPWDIIKKALAVIIISFAIVITAVMVLSLSEVGTFMDMFFEGVSAFATVGLSIGLTPRLTTIGKIIISITMFIGRLGPITLAVAISMRGKKKKVSIKKPEERVMVG